MMTLLYFLALFCLSLVWHEWMDKITRVMGSDWTGIHMVLERRGVSAF